MIRKLLVFASLVAGAACGFGQNGTPAKPDPLPASISNYTAVGASDTDGIGSSVPCVPFTPCPNGNGYVQLIQRHLQTEGKTVTLANLGVPGAVLNSEIQAIGNSLNRQIPSNLLDGQMSFVPPDSTIVTIFAGGNDANTIGAAVDAGLGGSNNNAYVGTEVQHFGRDMKTLVSTIKSNAPYAHIVVLNLPNLAGLPYAAGLSLAQKQMLQQISVGFSAQINGLTSLGVPVVDLMCDPMFYQPGSFSSDGFHPNDSGYAYLAFVIYPIAIAGTEPAPDTSCSQMTMF